MKIFWKKKKEFRKAQISFAEYLVAIVVFVTFASYFSSQLITFIPSYLVQLRNERVRGEAYQMTEILLNDPGFPINWHAAGGTRRIGLNDETKNVTNLISANKISALKSQCAGGGYSNVKRLLGTDLDFSITITVININTGLPEAVHSCLPTAFVFRAINTTIKRFASINNTHFAELVMQVI